MQDFTIVIPHYRGHEVLGKLLASLVPYNIPVLVVDDDFEQPFLNDVEGSRAKVIRAKERGFFTGAVNFGIKNTQTHHDVLVLNQDVTLSEGWLEFVIENQPKYQFFGEKIRGEHPAFPNGYVHGTFQYMAREAVDSLGLLDEEFFPLWGASADWHLRVNRAGFQAKAFENIPGFFHHRDSTNSNFGTSIKQALTDATYEQKAVLLRTPPLISVIIPCFNQGRFVPELLDSLWAQEFQGFEVIIVDDGSTDDSLDYLYAAVEGKASWGVSLVSLAKNSGKSAALNEGIDRAHGHYILVTDADDLRQPWSLASLLRLQLKRFHTFIYDSPTVIGSSGETLSTYDLSVNRPTQLTHKNYIHAGILFPKHAWVEVGGYEERMLQGREDWNMNLRLVLAGYTPIHDPRSGYLYRRHGANRTDWNTSSEHQEQFYFQIRQLVPEAFTKEGRDKLLMAESTCCGGTIVAPLQITPTSSAMASALANLGPEDLVQLQYLGKNLGTTKWGGPGVTPSGRRYSFGATPANQTKLVLAVDAPWFLDVIEKGARLFSIVEPVESEDTEDSTDTPEPVSTPEPADDDMIVDDGVVDDDDGDDEAALVFDVSYINDLKVQEIKQLTCSASEWAAIYEFEAENQDRSTVLEHAEGKVRSLNASAAQ